MIVHLKSQVRGNSEKVFGAFDEKLFRYLLPPGARLIRFDGSTPGSIVHLRLPPGVEWISEISETVKEARHSYFVDHGVKLPWPLVYWRHVHHVYEAGEERSRIEDAMEYRTSNLLLDILVYPFLYFAFLPRIWQYKKYFRTLNPPLPSTQSHNSY